MSILFDEVESALMDFVYRGIAVSTTAERYAGLVAGDDEITGPGYVRVRVDELMGAPASGETSNSGQIVWPVPTGDWTTTEPVTHVLLCEALLDGNALATLPLSAAKTIRAGDTVDIAPGQLRGSVGSNLVPAWRDKVADIVFRGVVTTETQQRWLGLMLSSGNEVSGGAYVRVRIDDKLSLPVDEGQGLRVTNSAVIAYPQATAAWTATEPVVSAMIFDAATGSGQICGVPFDDEIRVDAGDTFRFEPGNLVLGMRE